ncbi:MAG: agmatinase [Acidobacteria bacterium]|nr:agmatinase [Acidobacteriota bacterium]
MLDASITPAALKPDMVALLGLPLDKHSSFRSGAAAAPPRIRAALACESTNLSTENGLELGTEPRLADLGDLDLDAAGAAAPAAITAAVADVLMRRARVLALGGDHSVTLPVLRAYGPRFPGLTVVQLDAHPDLYDNYGGNRLSHACTFARVLEESLVTRLVQVGVRTRNPHQRDQAERFGVGVLDMRDWPHGPFPAVSGPVYLSVDLDILDPAFAPGVAHPEPGGCSTRELLTLIQTLPGPLVGADIVEYLPAHDAGDATARVAAKLVKELAARLLADD